MTFRWPVASLRSYLVAMILLASVPMAVFMSLQILRDARAQSERLNDSLLRTSAVMAESIDRELVASLDALQLLAEDAPPGDLQALGEHLQQRPRTRSSWQSLFIADPQGRVMVPLAGQPWPLPGEPAPDALGAQHVSDLVESQGRRAVVVSVALQGGHRLAAWIDVAHWQAMLGRVGEPLGGYAALFDGGRRIIARTRAPERAVGQPLPASAVAAMGQRASGVHRTVLLEGDATVVGWHAVGGTAWGVAVGVLSDPIEQQHRRALFTAVGTAALCLLLGVAMALWMARRVTGPLLALGAAGDGLAADGRPHPAPVREIEALRDAVMTARQEEAAARLRLQRQADEFEALFRGSPIGLAFAQDAQCQKVLRNRALDDMMRGPPGAEGVPVDVLQDGRLLMGPELPLAVAARTGLPVPAAELELRAGHAPARFVIMQTVPLLDTDGRSRGAIGAVLDITDRKRAEARLLDIDRERTALVEREQAARREAEQANQAKDEFLAMLGHELRNPLNAVASAVEVLKLLGGGGERADDARDIISRQTRHLAHLMDDLLDMARVASGKVVLERRPLDLGKLVAALVATMRLSGDTREHTLSTELQEVWVDADSIRIEQVAGNLLTNALKYTPPGGHVQVRVAAEGQEAVLEVRDNGVGIPPQLLTRAFDLFVQGERSLDRRAGGLGVGLTLVKRLVELHGGSVMAESAPAGSGEPGGPREGSVFRVRLPRIPSPPPPDARGQPSQLRGRTVLLVEDNDDALQALKAVLELDGHRVSTAADGEQGLALLLQQLPEVAVVDIGLPKLTGFEVARRSRAAGYAGRLIALSGYGMVTNTRQALQSGFDAHLTKPVDFDRLRELFDDR